jgi:hypothetical protein
MESLTVLNGHRESSPPMQDFWHRPLLIGWKEYLGFPEWGIRRMKVKIDTGARTSALDVARYELREGDASSCQVELFLALDRRHPDRLTAVHAPVLRKIVISNSNGLCEERPLIEATIRMGPITKRVPMTVTNRSSMMFRMILGRKALEGDFVVDVSRKYVLGKGEW